MYGALRGLRQQLGMERDAGARDQLLEREAGMTSSTQDGREDGRCLTCGGPLPRRRSNAFKFCSHACWLASGQANRPGTSKGAQRREDHKLRCDWVQRVRLRLWEQGLAARDLAEISDLSEQRISQLAGRGVRPPKKSKLPRPKEPPDYAARAQHCTCGRTYYTGSAAAGHFKKHIRLGDGHHRIASKQHNPGNSEPMITTTVKCDTPNCGFTLDIKMTGQVVSGTALADLVAKIEPGWRFEPGDEQPRVTCPGCASRFAWRMALELYNMSRAHPLLWVGVPSELLTEEALGLVRAGDTPTWKYLVAQDGWSQVVFAEDWAALLQRIHHRNGDLALGVLSILEHAAGEIFAKVEVQLVGMARANDQIEKVERMDPRHGVS
jgi:hypothetical protein